MTSNSLRMTVATHLRLHAPVANPDFAGPAFRIAFSFFSSTGPSFGLRPGCPALLSPSLELPVSIRSDQRRTLSRLTFNRRATSAWLSPRLSSFAACSLLRSNSSKSRFPALLLAAISPRPFPQGLICGGGRTSGRNADDLPVEVMPSGGTR